MSVRSKPAESGPRKGRLEHVLRTGPAQVPVGVAPMGDETKAWTVRLKLLATYPTEGHGYIELQVHPLLTNSLLCGLAKLGVAVARVPNEDLANITDANWPNDVYFVNIPDAVRSPIFDRIMINRIRVVAGMMSTDRVGLVPEAVENGWHVFTVRK